MRIDISLAMHVIRGKLQMSLSVIMPSKTDSNLIRSLSEVRRHEEMAKIFVVDDGLNSRPAVQGFENPGWLTTFLDGPKPFIFSRNCNLGIHAAGNDDVVLLNDDAILQTPGGFSAMQEAAAKHPEYGVLSATTNVAGNPDQHPRGNLEKTNPNELIRDAGSKTVAFVCVFIPRRTIAAIGLLDDRFVAYGWDDNDYCRRIREAGLKVGIFDGCYVDHGSLRSTYRGDPMAGRDNSAGAEIYRQKWGNLLY